MSSRVAGLLQGSTHACRSSLTYLSERHQASKVAGDLPPVSRSLVCQGDQALMSPSSLTPLDGAACCKVLRAVDEEQAECGKRPASAERQPCKDTPAVKQEQVRHNPDVCFSRVRTLYVQW